jgi:small-conductance mechanosensitive channel/CRP-like cAMP-binding protein
MTHLTDLTPVMKKVYFVGMGLAIYTALVIVGRWLKRKAGVQLGLMYKLFAIALALYIPVRLFNWKEIGKKPFTLGNDLKAACLLLGVFFLLSLMKRYLWEYYFGEKRGVQIPKFLREIFSAVIFIIALLLVASKIYNEAPPGVVLSSTVVVGIIGWAMQDLLGNVISGVALQLGKPFKAGDWLIVESQHAEVIEVNWRSTKLRTIDDHYLDLPNTSIVRSTIVNLSYPSHLHAMRVRIGLDYDTPPNRVKEVLHAAALSAKGVLSTPPPKVFLVDFGDSAVTYEIKYWLENHAAYNEISDGLRTAAWYALKRANIAIPFPIRTVRVEEKPKTDFQMPDDVRAVIRNKPFFKCLTDEQVQQIVGRATVTLFGASENIVKQGAKGSSMFILLTGEAAVYVRHHDHDGEPARVATLQGGDYFGEMSLLTGEVRSATVTATSDSQVLEIAKAQLAQILQENAALLTNLSEMLAQRRLDNEGVLASTSERHVLVTKKEEYAKSFLHSVARFFDL